MRVAPGAACVAQAPSGAVQCANYEERYAVERTIGVGSHGVARLVSDRADGSLWVLKEVALTPRSAEAAGREAALLTELRHPHVLALRESFVDEKRGALCLVTEYCAGGDLFELIERTREAEVRFEEAQIVKWLAQLASAVKYLHDRRVLHRDIKSQNIFLTKAGDVRIGDFGLCRVLEHTADLAMTVTGTPFYMAPEVCANLPYSTASDVWSVGCVVYELAMLRHTFDGSNLLSLVYAILQGDYERVGAPYSPELSQLVDACLQREPSKRPKIFTILQNPLVRAAGAELLAERKQRGLLRRQASMERAQAQAQAQGSGEDAAMAAMTPRERMLARKRAAADTRGAVVSGALGGSHSARQDARQRLEAQVNRTGVVAGVGTDAPPAEQHETPQPSESTYSETVDEIVAELNRLGGSEIDGGSQREEYEAPQTLPSSSSPAIDAAAGAFVPVSESSEVVPEELDAYSDDSDWDSDTEKAALGALADSLDSSNEKGHGEVLEDSQAIGGRRLRCAKLRARCERLLGAEAFQEAYDTLARGHTGDPEVRERLVQIVGKDNFSLAFLVDQLCFLERLEAQAGS